MSLASDAAAAEASTLAALVERHADALKQGALGTHFQLGSARFELHARTRNTIYRIAATSDWFLKLPVRSGSTTILHEHAGAPVVDAAVRGTDGYTGSAVTRTSVHPAYTLAMRVPGQPLNKIFFTRCWLPGAGAMLTRRFHLLGTIVARLHERARLTRETMPATTRPFETLAALLAGVRQDDRVTERLRTWYAANVKSDDGDSFIHGNLRFDNVLTTDGGIGFIDLENCGSGSFYQDLSRPVSELLLTECIVGFPHARARRCLEAFLTGYGEGRAFDTDMLAAFVSARLGRYYIEVRTRPMRSRRIGGLPVSKRRLDRLVLSALHGGVGLNARSLAHAY